VSEFEQAFDRDPAALRYDIEAEDWWLSNLPMCDLARIWDHWSRRLEPQTMPMFVTTCGVLRGGY
jgi:hypothetical protein